jgi:hypothetical protein
MRTYQIDASGSSRFTKIVGELRRLAARHGDIATYDPGSRLWTVRVDDGDFQASGAVDFARSAGATVTEADAPDLDSLRAERAQLVARLAEIDRLLDA